VQGHKVEKELHFDRNFLEPYLKNSLNLFVSLMWNFDWTNLTLKSLLKVLVS
jgi:hypothetical protein